ncbi:MAG: preprotein translocase subunit SecG [Pseudomonadota bacterium]
MQNILLIVHLILAICLIGVVLFQRSEGGALGIGGGGGGGLVSSRGAGTALSKLTWAIGAAFLCTSIMLTIASDPSGQRSLLQDIQSGGELTLPGAASDNEGGTTEGLVLPDLNVPGPAN